METDSKQVSTEETIADDKDEKRPRRHGGLIVLAIITGILLVAAVLLAHTLTWALKTFRFVSIDEILYQLNSPLAGTGGGMIQSYLKATAIPTAEWLGTYILCCVVIAHRVRTGRWFPQFCYPSLRKRKRALDGDAAVVGENGDAAAETVPKEPGKFSRAVQKVRHATNRFSCKREGRTEDEADRSLSRRTALALGATALIALGSSFKTLHTAWDKFAVADYFSTEEDGVDFVREHYVSPGLAEITFPEKKRNLLFIFLESMEITFSDIGNGGGFERGCIPELTRLAQEHEDFSGADPQLNGGISYAGTTWTMGAMFAQTSGLPLQSGIGGNAMNTQSEFFPGITTLGDILADQGYHQALMIGSDADFGGRKLYFTKHGDYEMCDYYWAMDTGRIPDDYKVWWGYEDYKLFQFAREYLTDAAKSGDPFNLTLLTVDTHFEDGYLCEHCPRTFGDNKYANVMACSSKQVNDFIEWCKEQSWFADTTIIITGDHPTMDSDFCEEVSEDYQRRVYTCYINPAAEPADPELRREYSTFDQLPTTLAAMGATIEGNRLGLGTNLFSDVPTLTEELGNETVRRSLNHNSPFVKELAAIDYDEAIENAYHGDD